MRHRPSRTTLLTVRPSVFNAYNLATAQALPVEQTMFEKTIPTLKWRPETVWHFQPPYARPSSPIVIKAGPRLYGHAGGKLIALENLDKQPHVAWEKELAERPTSLIAADNHLFIATAEGGIHCFGQSGECRPALRPTPVNPYPPGLKADVSAVQGPERREILRRRIGLLSGVGREGR